MSAGAASTASSEAGEQPGEAGVGLGLGRFVVQGRARHQLHRAGPLHQVLQAVEDLGLVAVHRRREVPLDVGAFPGAELCGGGLLGAGQGAELPATAGAGQGHRLRQQLAPGRSHGVRDEHVHGERHPGPPRRGGSAVAVQRLGIGEHRPRHDDRQPGPRGDLQPAARREQPHRRGRDQRSQGHRTPAVQPVEQLREAVLETVRAAHPQRPAHGRREAHRPPDPDVDAPRVQRRQGRDLLGDHEGGVVGQHHPGRPDPDPRRHRRDGGHQHRGRGTHHPGDGVVLGHPEPVQAELLGPPGPAQGRLQRVGVGAAGPGPRTVQQRQQHALSRPRVCRRVVPIG